MEIVKAREILGDSYKNKTDKDIQAIIDRLMPIVKLSVKEAGKEFKAVFKDPLEGMRESMGQLDITI